MVRRRGYPWGLTADQVDRAALAYGERWGTGVDLGVFQPTRRDDPATRRWWGRYQRMAASPGAAVTLLRMNAEMDVRGVLSAISVPTLVLHRRQDALIDVEHSRYLAQHIPGARLVEFNGQDHWPWPSEMGPIVEEIEEFLTGERSRAEPTRALATVLFTDIVGSTERAAQVGDSRWRGILQRHHAMVRDALRRHRGHEVKTIGDGFLATFDGPARGIRCARAICDGASDAGLEVRTGLHTGECELLGEDIGGLAVHIAARIAGQARPSEVLVSRTVTDLVAGSGITFESRGEQQLKGVPGAWELFAATD
jgi:class 3 adenylate cyclase